MRRNEGGQIGGAAIRVNQAPPQSPGAGKGMPINPKRFTDREVRTTLVQMARAITLQAQTMTAQAEQQGVPKKNQPSSTMVNMLRDFMRVNPIVYT